MYKHGRTATRTRTTSSSSDANDMRSEAVLRQHVSDAAEALAAELREGKSERLKAWLGFSSRFHHYSVGNQWLIMMQVAAKNLPDPLWVAGYKTWERMGYHPKGHQGIRILAPRPHTRERELADGTTEIRSHVSFASVPVFTNDQLDPEEVAAKPLPEFYHDLGSDAQTQALCTRVVATLEAAGIRVVEEDLGGSMQGYSAGKKIATRTGMSSRNRIRTLVHEWAHELLHQGAENAEQRARSKQVKECQAEATSYVVLSHFGIRNEFSSDYLQNWGNDAETLLAELGQVQKAATAIITALEPKREQSSEQERDATAVA